MNKKLGRLLRPNIGQYIGVMVFFVVITAAAQKYWLAAGEALLTGLMLAQYLITKDYRRRQLKSFVRKKLDELNEIPGAESPFPTLAFRIEDGGIIYTNSGFDRLSGFNDTLGERLVEDELPDFNTEWVAEGKPESIQIVSLKKRKFRVYGALTEANDPRKTQIGMLFFADLTELYQIRDEYINSRPVVSIILLDNQENLIKKLTEGEASDLNARVDRAIYAWAEQYHGLLRRIDKDRFLFLFEKRDLQDAIAGKFSILDEVHQIVSSNDVAASVSIGVGVGGEDFGTCYDYADLALDTALRRGGDQAVIKDRQEFHFIGDRTTETEHRSKVRSRVTANTMMKLIGQSSQVLIMGHKNADMDALGAAVGVCCMCRKKGTPAHIIIDPERNMAGDLLKELREVPEYKDVFISCEDILMQGESRSTLVVVDTNNPGQVECERLLRQCRQVCVIDHHRRGEKYITNPLVELHEISASSACELVTELLQYSVDTRDILPIEAKSLMAGIIMDTKSFNVRTGERTFEAATFLRKLGADTVAVKKLLKNDFQDMMLKCRMLQLARVYHEDIAIVAYETAAPRELASQAADELLNIIGINASFVIFQDGEQVSISARSIGELNVQKVLEPLTGLPNASAGGNAAIAGAQVKQSTVRDVTRQTVALIDQYLSPDLRE